MADPAKYRTTEQVDEWRARDPIKVLGEKLEALGMQAIKETIDREIEDEVQDAVRFGEESPFPDPSSAMDYVYVDQ